MTGTPGSSASDNHAADRPGTPAWGAGEPTACAIPAAIANAVFDATGVRLRSLPFTPDKVKVALAKGPTRA